MKRQSRHLRWRRSKWASEGRSGEGERGRAQGGGGSESGSGCAGDGERTLGGTLAAVEEGAEVPRRGGGDVRPPGGSCRRLGTTRPGPPGRHAASSCGPRSF